jgi:hypothetical protein
MKALFWISLIVSILLPLCLFGLLLFGFGGCVIPIVTMLIASICGLSFFLLALSSIILLLVDAIAVFPQWKRHRIRSLLPLTLIILGFLATIPVDKIARNLCQTRFQRHFSQYDQAASEIENSITPDGDYSTPSGTVFLSYVPPITYREDDESLTIEFIVGGVAPPPNHVAYIYRSNGVIGEGSRTAKRWPRTTRVNEHWFRASD